MAEAHDFPILTFRERLRWYVGLWRPLRWILPRLVILTVLSAALRVALPSLFAPVIDESLATGRPSLLVAAALLGVGVLRSVVYGLLQYTRASTNFALARHARERTFDHLTELGPDVYARHSNGDLLARLTDDCGDEKMSWFACSGAFRMFEAMFVIVFAATVMATISPGLTLMALLPLPFISIVYRLLANHLTRLYGDVQRRVSALEGFLDGAFTGIRAVKANGLEEAQVERFGKLVAAHRDAEIRAARGQTSTELLHGYGWQLILPLLVYGGGKLIMDEHLSMGAFTSFYGLSLLLVWPALDIGTFFARGRKSSASVARLMELEGYRPEVVSSGGAPVARLESGLELANVKRSGHDGRRELLSDVSLRAVRGGTTVLVGEVGSGKSSVLRLFPRIMDAQEGRVLVDSDELKGKDLPAWRRRLGYVPQEAHLLSATIEENLRLGREDLTPEQIKVACDTAQLGKDLALLPQGLATRVGERGAMLSGGQRQRVAIARALAHEPDVLILDDVGAALDADTEAALWDSLERLRPGLTKVVATHRSSLIERADHVVVLDRGKVVDQGSHPELLDRCGVYRDLYARAQLDPGVQL